MSELQIGDSIPNFKILIAKKQLLSSLDLLGQYIVLYFYPRDDTPGCTLEAQEFNSLFLEFKKCQTQIIGVSKDSLQSHDKFRNSFDLKFYLGSDTDLNLCKRYGAWVEKSMFGKKYMGIERKTFLIDKKGLIIYLWSKIKVRGHAQIVLDKVKEVTSDI